MNMSSLITIIFDLFACTTYTLFALNSLEILLVLIITVINIIYSFAIKIIQTYVNVLNFFFTFIKEILYYKLFFN